MNTEEENTATSFSYLSVNGLALTYDTSVVKNGTSTGPITSTTFSDTGLSSQANSLALNFTVAAGSGTLQINFLVLDPVEPSNGVTGLPPSPPPPVISLPVATVSGPATIRFVISNGQVAVWLNGTLQPSPTGLLGVPLLWQVQLQVTGTSPSFSIIGTFEERK
jgi:hypothetical protein